MKLLIDADFIVYKCCAAAEDEIDWGDDVIVVVSKFSEALSSVERELRIVKNTICVTLAELFCSSVTLKILGKKFTQITRVTEIERSPVATGELSQN